MEVDNQFPPQISKNKPNKKSNFAFAAAFERRKSFVLHSLERHFFDSEK